MGYSFPSEVFFEGQNYEAHVMAVRSYLPLDILNEKEIYQTILQSQKASMFLLMKIIYGLFGCLGLKSHEIHVLNQNNKLN